MCSAFFLSEKENLASDRAFVCWQNELWGWRHDDVFCWVSFVVDCPVMQISLSSSRSLFSFVKNENRYLLRTFSRRSYAVLFHRGHLVHWKSFAITAGWLRCSNWLWVDVRNDLHVRVFFLFDQNMSQLACQGTRYIIAESERRKARVSFG